MSKFTYGERKAFGRGVKCGFAKGLKSRNRKHKSNGHKNNIRNKSATKNYASTTRDDCWYL